LYVNPFSSFLFDFFAVCLLFEKYILINCLFKAMRGYSECQSLIRDLFLIIVWLEHEELEDMVDSLLCHIQIPTEAKISGGPLRYTTLQAHVALA
jgi:hypothetical protein